MSARLLPKGINVTAEYRAFQHRMLGATPAEKLAACLWARGLREQLDAEQKLQHDRALDRAVAELLKGSTLFLEAAQ